MKTIRLVSTTLAAVFIAAQMHADVLPPVQDSASLNGKLTVASGKATTLSISATRKGFVLFNLDSIPVDVLASQIVNARLRVYFPTAKTAGDINIHTVTGTWNETSAAAEPGVSGAPIAVFPAATIFAKKFVEVDVTTTVKGWRTNAGTNFGFAFLAAGNTSVTIGAKEGSGTGYPCELDLEIERSAASTFTAPLALALPGLHTAASQNGPSFLSFNIIGGSTVNTVAAGVTGTVIAGGGATNGFPQIINANYSSIGGGYSNTVTANGSQSVIAGGVGNTASSSNATIGGGTSNSVSGSAGTVGGGSSNTVSGSNGTVPGGNANTAGGATSFAAGNRAKALNAGSFVWGDSTNADVTSTANDQMTIRATGGVVLNAAAGVALTANATNAVSVPVGTLYKDNTVVAWGRVSGNGTLNDAFNVASVVRNSAGNYTVTLNTSLSGTALVPVVSVSYVGAQPTTAAGIRIAAVNQLLSNTAFNVFINSGTFAAADADFTFIVTGR